MAQWTKRLEVSTNSPMTLIWFIYGLAFFVLGLAIIVYPKKGSKFKLANHIWMIAAFGILHAANEWLVMAIDMQQLIRPDILRFFIMLTLSTSFLFLVWFGAEVIVETKKKYRPLLMLPIALFAIWALIFLMKRPYEQRLLIGEISARYLLCVPGTLLAAIGLFLYIPQFNYTKLARVRASLRLAAITFVLYGVLAGLIVSKAKFFPAAILNYDLFLDSIGIPVQIFRAICAVVLAGSITYVLSVFHWETQEALRKSEQRCSAIALGMPIILFVQDSDATITFVQGKGLEALGLEPDQLIGRRFWEVLPSAIQFEQDANKALAGEEFTTTAAIESSVFEVCYAPLRGPDGDITGIIGAALDITTRVHTEDTLDKCRHEMEKNARLVEVGMMAQQLNEPITATRMLLEELTRDLAQTASPRIAVDNLNKSLKEIAKAAEIVSEFPGSVWIDQKAVTQQIGLNQITKRMVSIVAQKARHANLTICVRNMDIVPYMSISPRELEHVCLTIIENAIDAAVPNERQNLHISCYADDRHIELLFEDTCRGIATHDLRHIFEPLFSSKSKALTAGMGLAVAKRIVETHGGNITVESQVGKGAAFNVMLPIEYQAQ